MAQLDYSNLTPDSLELIENQSTMCIGTIGHAQHGKSTLVASLTGIATQKFESEKRRSNKTIKLGYSATKIYMCPNCRTYTTPSVHLRIHRSNFNGTCAKCQSPLTLVRHVSFMDCPGHHDLLKTMLSGTSVMDCCLLLISASDKDIRQMAVEHIRAVGILGIKNVIVVQNKIDLPNKQVPPRIQYGQIREFMKLKGFPNPVVIPASATDLLNIDYVLQAIVEEIPIPKKDFFAPVLMSIVRSFDNNKKGVPVDSLFGGSAGGTIIRGYIKVGDQLELRPSQEEPVLLEDPKGESNTPKYYVPRLVIKVEQLRHMETELPAAFPGGLISVNTDLDPALARQDRLLGSVIGAPGHLPKCYTRLYVFYCLEDHADNSHQVDKLYPGNDYYLLLAGCPFDCKCRAVKGDFAAFDLARVCCTEMGVTACICCDNDLIGYAKLLKGDEVDVLD